MIFFFSVGFFELRKNALCSLCIVRLPRRQEILLCSVSYFIPSISPPFLIPSHTPPPPRSLFPVSDKPTKITKCPSNYLVGAFEGPLAPLGVPVWNPFLNFRATCLRWRMRPVPVVRRCFAFSPQLSVLVFRQFRRGKRNLVWRVANFCCWGKWWGERGN